MTSITHKTIDSLYQQSSREPDAKRRGINSVEIGIRILEIVVELKTPSSLKNITELSDMSTSQVHRYLSSLVNCGLLRQEANSGLYDLGLKSLNIGLSALSRIDPISIISSATHYFSRQLGHTCLLSIWSINGPIIINWFSGSPPVYTTLTIGSVMPVTTSATGKVFMSFLQNKTIEPFLKSEGGKLSLENNKELLKSRDEIRSSGISAVKGSLITGLRAYASPVFGPQNVLIATLTVIASERDERSEDEKISTELLSLCQSLTNELGGQWPNG
jgi:DNA-binding IclR family transcriptional regulator